MGFDEKRIQSRVNLLHRCGLCFQLCDLDLLVESKCLHVFCRSCFHTYWQTTTTSPYGSDTSIAIKCPVSGKLLKPSHLRKGLLDELTRFSIRNYKITCDFKANGCSEVVSIGKLAQHTAQCRFKQNSMQLTHRPTTQSSSKCWSSASSSSMGQFYVELNSTQCRSTVLATTATNNNVFPLRESSKQNVLKVNRDLQRIQAENLTNRRRAISIESLIDLSPLCREKELNQKIDYSELSQLLFKCLKQVDRLSEDQLLKQQEQLIELKLKLSKQICL